MRTSCSLAASPTKQGVPACIKHQICKRGLRRQVVVKASSAGGGSSASSRPNADYGVVREKITFFTVEVGYLYVQEPHEGASGLPHHVGMGNAVLFNCSTLLQQRNCTGPNNPQDWPEVADSLACNSMTSSF
jgi:hypothetical protein